MGDSWGASRVWRALLVAAAVGSAAGYSVRRFRRFEVTGESMTPALEPGDYLVVDRDAFLRARPRAGEVVVARDPANPGRLLVKRVAKVDGQGRAWLLGDNRAASTDSRSFGWVGPEAVVGRAVWRYWPAGRAGRVR